MGVDPNLASILDLEGGSAILVLGKHFPKKTVDKGQLLKSPCNFLGPRPLQLDLKLF